MIPLVPVAIQVGISVAAGVVVKGLKAIARKTDNTVDDAILLSVDEEKVEAAMHESIK